MSTQAIIDRFTAQQGWSDTSVLSLLTSYIENQQDDASFEDFLSGVADLENEGDSL